MDGTQKLSFPSIPSFTMTVNYSEWDSSSPNIYLDSHIHREYELYINLSGDVSFITSDRIYPIKPGDVVLTRPFSYHHCVYHSKRLHRHFWILISSECRDLLDSFWDAASGSSILLTFTQDHSEALLSLCHKMLQPHSDSALEYYLYFRLLTLLKNARETTAPSQPHRPAVSLALNYIGQHFAEKISVREIAEHSFVSINTLERHFMEELKISPSHYLKQVRMAHATRLLSEGCPVQQACDKSGFSDCSRFIADFKSLYGITPLKYARKCSTP